MRLIQSKIDQWIIVQTFNYCTGTYTVYIQKSIRKKHLNKDFNAFYISCIIQKQEVSPSRSWEKKRKPYSLVFLANFFLFTNRLLTRGLLRRIKLKYQKRLSPWRKKNKLNASFSCKLLFFLTHITFYVMYRLKFFSRVPNIAPLATVCVLRNQLFHLFKSYNCALKIVYSMR